MAGVSEAHAALGGALVAAVLKVDDAFAGLHLLFAELPHVLRRFFGSDAGYSEIGALPNENLSRIFGNKLYCYNNFIKVATCMFFIWRCRLLIDILCLVYSIF